MTNNKDRKKQAGWKPGADRGRQAFAKRMALAKHWQARWEKEPEFMRENLERLIASNKAGAVKYTEQLNRLLAVLPPTLKSWELRPAIAKGIQSLGGTGEKPQVHKVVMALTRRRMATFDSTTFTWHLANVSTK